MARDSEEWAAYYAKTGARPPRQTLLFALDQFDRIRSAHGHLAVDLGSGGGRDVIEMLRRDWSVIAIDAEAAAAAALTARDDLPEGLFWRHVWPPLRTPSGRNVIWSIQVSHCLFVPLMALRRSGKKSA